MSAVKVLLRADVSGVGRRGDIVEVQQGFARNYLIPHGRAQLATPGAVAQAEAMVRTRSLKDRKDRESALELAKRLEGTRVALSARAGEGGKLFGSISAADVRAALVRQTGAEIDRRDVHLDEHIKVVGEHPVSIRLAGDVELTITAVVSAA